MKVISIFRLRDAIICLISIKILQTKVHSPLQIYPKCFKLGCLAWGIWDSHFLDIQVIVGRINSSNVFSSTNWISIQKEFRKRSIESATGYRRKLIRVGYFMTCHILCFELFQIFESRMIRVEISCSIRDTLILVHYLLYTMEIRQIIWL